MGTLTKFGLLGMLGAGLLSAATCVSDTAANYVTNFSGTTGCTITSGGVTLLFNQFAFIQANSGGTGGASNQINFNPLADINGLGFDIVPTTAFTASATHVNDIQINFVASVVGGASLINDLFLSMTGTTGAAGVGGGLAGTDILSEQFCRGGSVPPGSCPAGQGGNMTDILTITGASSNVTVSDTKTFALTNALSVLKDIQLTGNNGSVPSAVTDVKNQISVVSSVPEPTTAFLLGGGLIALGLMKSRSRKSRQV
jgi:hypothetical protein